MKAHLFGFAVICLAKLQAQTVELKLASSQADDLFGGRKYDLALVIYSVPNQKRELPGRLFQIAGKLLAPVPQSEQKPLLVEAGDAVKHSAVYPVELPKVERKTRFLIRFEGAEALGLTIYPETLLQPLRDLAEKDVKLFTLTSAGELGGFLKREKVHATEIGAKVSPDFTERGIIMARKETAVTQVWPTQLLEGQALVIFYPPDADDLPRITAAPLGRGVLIQVRMRIIEKLADSPRAQENFTEIINFVCTQLNPSHPTQTP